MSFNAQGRMLHDQREASREEVYYRTRCSGPRGVASLQIVNISASGFMARSEGEFAEGDKLNVRLPVLGTVSVEVRWSLGGRVGCQFDRMVDLAPYLQLLSELVAHAH
jgi:hypothetical protein